MDFATGPAEHRHIEMMYLTWFLLLSATGTR